ncbi:hypothetical protein E3T24_14715 [Cryobacterium sp. TmT2-59]|nr:hypothetical protein E3T24_14715 [Cryobacterium sp. TmT2-59]
MLFTSTGLLAAEDTLLAAGRTRTIAPITVAEFDRTAARHTGPLDAGQRAPAREFRTSGTLLVVATGPAGAGKTTALALAARATEQAGGRLIGLAPVCDGGRRVPRRRRGPGGHDPLLRPRLRHPRGRDPGQSPPGRVEAAGGGHHRRRRGRHGRHPEPG